MVELILYRNQLSVNPEGLVKHSHIFVPVRRQDINFHHNMSWSFFVFNGLRWEMIVCFVDIGGIIIPPLSIRPSQDIFRRIFLSNYWWQKSGIWSQASYRYAILWGTFLDPSDSYFPFADLVGFYTHWTYMRGYHKWALAHSSSCWSSLLKLSFHKLVRASQDLTYIFQIDYLSFVYLVIEIQHLS